MLYLFPLLALLLLVAWLHAEIRASAKSFRIAFGVATFTLVFGSGYRIGGFAEFNKYRFYPLAVIKISEELRAG